MYATNHKGSGSRVKEYIVGNGRMISVTERERSVSTRKSVMKDPSSTGNLKVL